ncbi:MAG TPA: hypothetical protein VHO70_17340 [Chitinispirillaceae bacterium]|nr:hypothetical protein [Chitinispirillaceae bacterium]
MKRLTYFVQMLFLFSLIFRTDAQEITINYPDFSDVSKWQLNGEPRANSMKNRHNETVLRLTPPEYHTYGTAFLKDPIPLEDERGFRGAFSAFFSFRIGDGQGIDGADGLTFTIQTIANDVGSFGGGLGFDGIDRSVAIEFDTYKNSDRGDLDASHAGIDTNGSLVSIAKTSINPPMDDYRLLYAWVDYDGDTKLLELRVSSTPSRPERTTTSVTIDIPKIIGSKNAFIGFTAATGEAWNAHEILSFSFTNRFKPYAYTLSLTATPDTIMAFGDTATVTATVIDELLKNRENLASLTKWRIVPSGGSSPATLLSSTGKSVKVVPTNGGSSITIEASVDSGAIHLKQQIVLVVKQLNYQLTLSAVPDTVVNMGDTVTLTARIIDERQQSHPVMADSTQWSIVSSGGNPSTILFSNTGSSVKMVPSIPSSQIVLEASIDSADIHLKKQIIIHVRSLSYSLHLNASPDTTVFPGDTVTLTADVIDNLTHIHPALAELSKWKLVSANGNPPSVLLSDSGKTVKVVPMIVQTSIIIEASVDSANVHLSQQITLRIKGTLSVPCITAAILDSISENKNPILLLAFNEQINTTMLSSRSPSDALLYTSTNSIPVSTIFAGAKFHVLNNSSFDDSIIVELGSNGALIVLFLDSLKIASGTVNQGGIAPQPARAKNVAITTDKRRIRISSSANPFTINSTIDPRIIAFFDIKSPSSGTIISIFSVVPLYKERDGSYGRATIYDATGNIVKKDVQIDGTSVNSHYYHFEWNGLNYNSRKVGYGTYLAIVQIQDIHFQKSTLRYKIGVKTD